MEKKSNKGTQYMRVLTSSTIRGIVRTVNDEEIKKEDIITLLKDREQFILVYFQ